MDPVTGDTDFMVELDEPLDLFDTEDRLLRLDGDRWLLRDGAATKVVDFAASTVEEGDPETVGWCETMTELEAFRDAAGEEYSYRDPGFLRPCVLAGQQASEDELLAPVIDGRLTPPESSTVVAVGRWTIWVDGGRLAGVKTTS